MTPALRVLVFCGADLAGCESARLAPNADVGPNPTLPPPTTSLIAYGRPVGVALDRRGALLVADDVGNVIWRVSAASQR